jgi:DNA invertase Pin-like site-specific DNA recombinase
MISNGQSLKEIPCAIYTRKSNAEGLEQEFNSLDAQREAVEKYIESQRGEGFTALPDRYDDGGFTGGNTDRPALKKLMEDVRAGKVGAICVYKVDRLSRSLLDFVKLMEVLERHNVSFISVTQHFNTNTSMGRLILNVLLSFAQFEREVISERIRDKIAMAKAKGKNMGGVPPLGYDVVNHKLVVNPGEAEIVRDIFSRFVECGSTTKMVAELKKKGVRTKSWTTVKGRVRKGSTITKNQLYRMLGNRKYLGEVTHRDKVYPGEHKGIIDRSLWDKVHSIIAVNRRARAGIQRPAESDLLKGILFCGCCGSAMVRSYTKKRSGRTYRYYLCNTALKQGYAACPVGGISSGEIEAQIIARVRHHLKTPVVVGRAAEKARLEAEGSGAAIDPAAIARQVADLESAWEHLFPAEQTRLVRLLVQTVHVQPDGLRVGYREAGFASLVHEMAGPPAFHS